MSYEESYFGNCPECHLTDGMIHIGREAWFVCETHRLIWPAGPNLCSSCRDILENLSEAHRLGYEDYGVLDVKDVWHPAAQVRDIGGGAARWN